VLRAHCDTIVSVLETFVHDPTIDWKRHGRQPADEENPHARDALSVIEGAHQPWCRSTRDMDGDQRNVVLAVRRTPAPGPVHPAKTISNRILW